MMGWQPCIRHRFVYLCRITVERLNHPYNLFKNRNGPYPRVLRTAEL
jgi:hypothetical protein